MHATPSPILPTPQAHGPPDVCPLAATGTWSQILARLSSHYKTKQPLPQDLLDKLIAAKNVNVALFTLRQVYLATLDMQIHTEPPEDLQVPPPVAHPPLPCAPPARRCSRPRCRARAVPVVACGAQPE